MSPDRRDSRRPLVDDARMGRDAGASGLARRRAVALDFGGVFQAGGEFWARARAAGDETGRRIEAGMDRIFHHDKRVSDAWMRGELDARQVLAEMGVDLSRPRLEDWLLRELAVSIAGLPVDAGVENLVRAWRERVTVILATDNVREFRLVVEESRTGGGEAGTLAGAAPLFDGIICSASEGALKADPPAGVFFRSWAARNALDPGDILLVDDRELNCAAWQQAGGAAVRWRLGQDPLDVLDTAVAGWLDCGVQVRPSLPA